MPDIGSIGNIDVAIVNNIAQLSWDSVANATNYDIFIDDELVQTFGNVTSGTYAMPDRKFYYVDNGTFAFKYKAKNTLTQQESAFSESVNVGHCKYLGFPMMKKRIDVLTSQNYIIQDNFGLSYIHPNFGFTKKEYSNAEYLHNTIREILVNDFYNVATIMASDDKVYYIFLDKVMSFELAGAELTIIFADEEELVIVNLNERIATINYEDLEFLWQNRHIDFYKTTKTIRRVDGIQHSTIQDAIDNAQANELIVVSPGEYANIVVDNTTIEMELEEGVIITGTNTHAILLDNDASLRLYGKGQIVCDSNDAYDCCIKAEINYSSNVICFASVTSLRHTVGRCVAYMQGQLFLKATEISNDTLNLSCWDWDKSATHIDIDVLDCKSPQNVGIFITYQSNSDSLFIARNCHFTQSGSWIQTSANSAHYTLMAINCYSLTTGSANALCDNGYSDGYVLYILGWHLFVDSVESIPFTLADDEANGVNFTAKGNCYCSQALGGDIYVVPERSDFIRKQFKIQ